MKPENDPGSTSDPYSEQELRALVRLAKSVSEEAGDLKELAFETVLKRLLSFAHFPSTPEISRFPSRRERGKARRPGAPGLGTIPPVDHRAILARLNATPESIARWGAIIDELPAKFKPYGVLAFARDHGVDGLTLPELRLVLNDTLRLGIADGTMKSALSRAPVTELGRPSNERGETVYKLLRAGDDVLASARQETQRGQAPGK